VVPRQQVQEQPSRAFSYSKWDKIGDDDSQGEDEEEKSRKGGVHVTAEAEVAKPGLIDHLNKELAYARSRGGSGEGGGKP
jgi:hypothetical protein